jgi:hypothetical protein
VQTDALSLSGCWPSRRHDACWRAINSCKPGYVECINMEETMAGQPSCTNVLQMREGERSSHSCS